MNFKKIIAAAVASVMAVGTMAVAASAADYIAGFTFQTGTYIFRDTIAQSKILFWDNEIGEAVEVAGSFKDATITGNGTYTVELSGVEDNSWNMLKIDTNISSNDYPNINMVVKSIEVDGAAVDFNADDVAVDLSQHNRSNDYSDYEFEVLFAARVQLINTYDSIAAIENKAIDSVKVTFEITGMDDGAAASDENGGTEGAGTDDKNTPDTGVEGVAVEAGIAVLAAGAIIVAKKRK